MVKRKKTREKKNRMKIQRVIQQTILKRLLIGCVDEPCYRVQMGQKSHDIASVIVQNPNITISLSRKQEYKS